MPEQDIIISSANPVDFINRVVEVAKQGAVLKPNTCPRIKTIPFIAQFVLETRLPLPVSPGVNAIPFAVKDCQYSKEELEVMEWADFKVAVKDIVPKGRDRVQMQRQYLSYWEDKEQE